MSLENNMPRETANSNDVPLPSDPLIDALLEEIIGGQSPPDLAVEILSQLHDTLPATLPMPGNDFDSILTPKSTVVARRKARRRSFAIPVSMVLSVTAIALALVAIVLNSPDSSISNQNIANEQTQTIENPNTPRIVQSNDNSPDSENPSNLLTTAVDDSNSHKPINPSNLNSPHTSGTDSLPPIQQRWQHPLALANTHTVAPVETDVI